MPLLGFKTSRLKPTSRQTDDHVHFEGAVDATQREQGETPRQIMRVAAAEWFKRIANVAMIARNGRGSSRIERERHGWQLGKRMMEDAREHRGYRLLIGFLGLWGTFNEFLSLEMPSMIKVDVVCSFMRFEVCPRHLLTV